RPPGQHPPRIVHAWDLRLTDQPIGAVLADALQWLLRRRLVHVVVDGDPRAALRELQRDAPADASRSSGDERMRALERHGGLLSGTPAAAPGIPRRGRITPPPLRVRKGL